MRYMCNLSAVRVLIFTVALLVAMQAAVFADDWTCPNCGQTFQFDPRDSDYRSQWISLHLSVCGGGGGGGGSGVVGPSAEELKRIAEEKDAKEASDDAVDRGNECYKKGDWAGAIRWYQEALEYNPDNDDAQYNLQQAQVKAEEARAAMAALEKARLAKEAEANAAALKAQREAKRRQLEEELNNIKLPPPLPTKEVSLSWDMLSLSNRSDGALQVADGLMYLWDVAGRLGGKALPACKVILMAGKIFIAGEDGALVYLAKQDEVYDKMLGYLKDPATAQQFAGIVRDLREGKTPESADPEMLRVAGQVGKSSTQILWDAWLSPEAKAAMVRKACIEVGSELVGQGGEGLMSEITKRKDLYEAARLNRSKLQGFLREAESKPAKVQFSIDYLKDTIAHSNDVLRDLYRTEQFGVKSLMKIETEQLGKAVEKGSERQEIK